MYCIRYIPQFGVAVPTYNLLFSANLVLFKFSIRFVAITERASLPYGICRNQVIW